MQNSKGTNRRSRGNVAKENVFLFKSGFLYPYIDVNLEGYKKKI